MKGTRNLSRAVMPLLLIAASAIAQTVTMQAQTVNWYEWSGSSAPPSREDMSMVYDLSTHSTLLFGGCCSPSLTLGDTWIFDEGWSQLFPSPAPSSRMGAAVTYDRAARNIVLFGGCTGTVTACTFLNDTWTWDGVTKTWTQQFPPVSPSPRVTSIAYDEATKTAVLFGGGGTDGALADTWTWDGIAKTWTQHNPAASPPARQAPLAYDASTRTVVLFGGGKWTVEVPGSGGTAYGDTWTWDGATWEQKFPSSSPSPRSFFSMAYDRELRLIVLFGGALGGDWPNSASDTWTWNGSDWTQFYPATVPPNRYNFGMDYDARTKVTFMFGGDSTGPSRNDTWGLAFAP